jgi:hypothetical protein
VSACSECSSCLSFQVGEIEIRSQELFANQSHFVSSTENKVQNPG